MGGQAGAQWDLGPATGHCKWVGGGAWSLNQNEFSLNLSMQDLKAAPACTPPPSHLLRPVKAKSRHHAAWRELTHSQASRRLAPAETRAGVGSAPSPSLSPSATGIPGPFSSTGCGARAGGRHRLHTRARTGGRGRGWGGAWGLPGSVTGCHVAGAGSSRSGRSGLASPSSVRGVRGAVVARCV